MNFKSFFYLTESKQDITNLGFPEVISKILYEKFGSKSFIISKWIKNYKYNLGKNETDYPENWWQLASMNLRRFPDLYQYTVLYKLTENPEEYCKTLNKMDIDFFGKEHDYEEERSIILSLIKQELENFLYEFLEIDFIKKILNNEIDFKQYKNLDFQKAFDKYNKKLIFKDVAPDKIYENGYKWINCNNSNDLIAQKMKNCGNTNFMHFTKHCNMFVLFDKYNKGHAICVYARDENIIKGIEGVASTTIKDKYVPYILDLAKLKNAKIDYLKSNNKYLVLKYLFPEYQIERLSTKDKYNDLFSLESNENKYFSNGYCLIKKEDIEKSGFYQGVFKLEYGENSLENMFNHRNVDNLINFGIKPYYIYQFNI